MQYNVLVKGPANETDKHSFPTYAYPQYLNGSMYVEYEPLNSLYDHDLADVAWMKVICRKNSLGQYTYEAVYPQSDHNVVHQSHVNANSCDYVCNRLAIDSFDRDDKCYVKNGLINEPENSAPKRINHLDVQPCVTYNSRHVGDNDDGNGKNCIVTAMNIMDEENDIEDSSENIAVSDSTEAFEKKFGLHISIPNYTYVDTSDSSASSDSSDSSDTNDSICDNEYPSDSCQKGLGHNNDTTSNNTSSDSDSGSYVVYSTSLNSYEKMKEDTQMCIPAISLDSSYTDAATYPESSMDDVNRECSLDDSERISMEKTRSRKGHSGCSDDPNFRDAPEQDNAIRAKGYNENHADGVSDLDISSDKTNSDDRELDAEQRDQRHRVGDSEINAITDQLGVVRKKQLHSKKPHYQNEENIDGQNGAPFEATDDLPDNSETTVVSVALPLRFQFFVSENNEDITTVIVGDSKIKTEKSRSTKGEHSMKDDKVNDVCVSFHVGNDTSVDFTIKRNGNLIDTNDKRNTAESKATNVETVVPCVNFTLRKDSTNVDESTCEEHADTEFAVACTAEHERISSTESSLDADDSELMIAAQDSSSKNGDRDNAADAACNDFENETRDDVESKIPTPGCSSRIQHDSEAPRLQVIDASSDDRTDQSCSIAHNDEDQYIDPEIRANANHLLSVSSDTRKDTDDEDSGITSDITRAISEADTDSECIPSRDMKVYQRTQTHSRLFRLLNDDSIPPPCSEADAASETYMNLKPNAFDDDDNYGSTYSSGLTSPECSAIRKQPRRRFHNATGGSAAECPSIKINRYPTCCTEQASCKDDPYFRTWKDLRTFSPYKHNAVPSLTFRTLDSKMPLRAYRANVLCPRIKSARSVPETLLARQQIAQSPPTVKTDDPSIVPSIPTPCATIKTNYC